MIVGVCGDRAWPSTYVPVAGAVVGIIAPIRTSKGKATGVLLAVYAACLVLSGIKTPDPLGGFADSLSNEAPTISGLLYLLFGSVGFVCAGSAALRGVEVEMPRPRRYGALCSVHW